MNNVMVDLETLGNGSNAVIVAIGAVEFDDTGVGRSFYTVVDAQTCVDVGLNMDASTVMWWLGQSEAARRALMTDEKISIATALLSLSEWWPKDGAFWGNGATFDNVIVANAYQKCRIMRPWKYTADRCYRTMKAMFPEIKPDAGLGTAHNALDDAKYQALHMVKILNALKG